MDSIGFGSDDYQLAFCVANRPNLDDYPKQSQLRPLASGELDYIVRGTSNHWRKLFNVYAKFLFELRGDSCGADSWQHYRDRHLLQDGSSEALLFSPPSKTPVHSSRIHIIAGKTHAANLDLPYALTWVDAHFAINVQQRVIVSPYLDYRQLSNERITRLVELVRSLMSKTTELETIELETTELKTTVPDSGGES